jgi:hypothetical protein
MRAFRRSGTSAWPTCTSHPDEDLPTAQQVASNLGEASRATTSSLTTFVIVERKNDVDRPATAQIG